MVKSGNAVVKSEKVVRRDRRLGSLVVKSVLGKLVRRDRRLESLVVKSCPVVKSGS